MKPDPGTNQKNPRRVLAAACVIGLAGVSATVQAENWYGGVSVGTAKVVDFTICDEIQAILDPGSSCSAEDTATAWKAFFGNQFSPNAAVEFGFVNLGTVTVDGSGTLTGIPVVIDGDWKVSGLTISLAGNLPLGKEFSLTGRAGMFLWSVDLDGAGGSESASGTGLSYGIGLQYDFTKTTGLRLDWERFADVGDEDKTGQSDIDLLSAGLVFRF